MRRRPSWAGRPGRTCSTATWAAGPRPRAWPPSGGSPACWPRRPQDRLLAAAHDLSDGGLAVALAESCLRGGVGCSVRLPGDPFTWLFSESAARAIVAVRPGAEEAFGSLLARHDVPGQAIGVVGGDHLVVAGCFSIPLAELAAAHRATLPALFG